MFYSFACISGPAWPTTRDVDLLNGEMNRILLRRYPNDQIPVFLTKLQRGKQKIFPKMLLFKTCLKSTKSECDNLTLLSKGQLDFNSMAHSLRTDSQLQSRPIKVKFFFIKMRTVESRPSFDMDESLLALMSCF